MCFQKAHKQGIETIALFHYYFPTTSIQWLLYMLLYCHTHGYIYPTWNALWLVPVLLALNFTKNTCIQTSTQVTLKIFLERLSTFFLGWYHNNSRKHAIKIVEITLVLQSLSQLEWGEIASTKVDTRDKLVAINFCLYIWVFPIKISVSCIQLRLLKRIWASPCITLS